METVRSADGTTIAFDRIGDGPPLILVLGAFSDRSAPRPLAARLAGDFTVYAYDRRGRGDSGDHPEYAVERELGDLDAMIGAAGGSALVYGHSSGAAIALRAAAAGLPIAKLVAYEPPYFVEGSRPINTDMERQIRDLVESGDRAGAIRLFMIEGILESPKTVIMMERMPLWSGLLAGVHTLRYDLACCGGHVIPRADLARITIPTLLVGGGASPTWYRDSVRAVAEAVPTGHVLLDYQTHGPTDDAIAPILTRFLG